MAPHGTVRRREVIHRHSGNNISGYTSKNRVGGKRKFSSYFRFPTSHTTVHAGPHTAVPYLQ